MLTAPLKVATFPTTPWKWDVVVLHGGTTQKAGDVVRGILDDKDVAVKESSAGHAWVYEGKPAILWVHDLRDVPVLVHELIHVVFGLLEARGLKHGDASEEAFTYTLEDLLRRIIHAKKWARA